MSLVFNSSSACAQLLSQERDMEKRKEGKTGGDKPQYGSGQSGGDAKRRESGDRLGEKVRAQKMREGRGREEKVVVREAPKRKVKRGMGLGQRLGIYFFFAGMCALIFFAAQGRFKLVFQYDRGFEFVVGVLDKNNRTPEKNSWYAFSFEASDRPVIASVVMFQRNQYSKLFVKRMACLPGERLNYRGSEFMCEDASIGKGIVKNELSGQEVKLYRWAGVVPPKKFFSVGMTRESYDSKYRGFVDSDWIVGKVYPLLWMPHYLAKMMGEKLEVK